MAVVRMTDTLKAEVRAHATKLFEKRHEAARAFACPHTPQELYDKMFAPWKGHMLALPSEIIPRHNEFTIVRVGDISLDYKVTLPVAMPLPSRLPANGSVSTNGYYHSQYTLSGQEWDDMYALAQDRKARMAKVEADLQTFKEGVDKVLSRYSTLAPALKAWPALWDLLSESTKDKHRQVVSRNKANVPLEDVDVNRLTAAVVMTKLTA